MSATHEETASATVLAEVPPAPVAVPPPPPVEARPPLFDREISWLHFNRRVLGEAENPAVIEEDFARNIEPILTPLAIDPGHPFPFIANLALNLTLQLESDRGESYVVVVKLPELSPRLVPVGEGRYVLLEDVISSHVGRF